MVVTAANLSVLHNLPQMRVSSSSAVVTETPSLASLSSNRAVDGAGRHSSGDTASPGFTNVAMA